MNTLPKTALAALLSLSLSSNRSRRPAFLKPELRLLRRSA